MPVGPPNLKRGGRPRNAADRRSWLWGLLRELARLRADLIHGPDFAVPYLRRRPSVLTLHDLSPWIDPSWHHAAGRVRRRTPLLLELGLPTMIVTPSEHVRKQAIERFRIRPERIVAVPEMALIWILCRGAGHLRYNAFLLLTTSGGPAPPALRSSGATAARCQLRKRLAMPRE
jgi:hypothetical protein